MWNRIKGWFGANQEVAAEAPKDEASYKFKWYDPGSDNPFPIRVLDVRSLTWHVVATTRDARVAESFNAQRLSDGREIMDAEIEDSRTVECNLVFPYDGAELEGIVFKSDSMDVKWDVYIYNSAFLFVRSWTGRLQYRAFAEFTETEIRIYAIECSVAEIDLAPQAVYFILGTHAMGRVLPHSIPRDFPDNPEQIGWLSFKMYGNLGCYATYEDITQIKIPRPEAKP